MKRIFVILLLLSSAVTLASQTLEAERLPDMNVPRAGHNVFYVNGELTVVGGHTSGFVMTPTAEYFSDGAWHLVPTVYHHDNGMAVVMNDGKKVLLAGDHDKNLGIGQSFEAEIYDSETHTSEGFGGLERSRAFAQGVELADGQVLIAGNHKDNDVFEVFDGKKSFSFVKDVSIWRSSPYMLPIANDEVICFGSVRRLGLITFRVAMILTSLRLMDGKPIQSVIVCDDTDFRTSLIMARVLLQHTANVFGQLPSTDTNSTRGAVTVLCQTFFDSLPSEFNRRTYLSIAERLHIAPKTAEKYIRKFCTTGQIKHLAHDSYSKM